MMMKRLFPIVAALTATLLVTQLSARMLDGIEGRYRIDLMNGSYVEGDVKELPDGSYEVKTKHGVVVTVKKSEVRGLRPLDAAAVPSAGPAKGAAAAPSAMRREISDAEIEQLLADIVAKPDESLTGADREAMLIELPVDEESLAEMKRMAGPEAKVLLKPHFVMVYTSTEQSAIELGSRLESVYRWNVVFMNMMGLPARKPEHKLEVYYFATFKEYEAYSLNQGFQVNLGGGMIALGYYKPDLNRSHFFDMNTSPGIAEFNEILKDKAISYERRQFARNRIRRYVDFKNMEVIQHETGHHIHFNIGLFPRDAFGGQNVPLWLVEGTTMMFEVPPSSAGASLGALNHYRLNNLRNKFGSRPLNAAEWKLFLIDNGQWHNAAGHGNVVDSYQLGWSMVYYLWKQHRDGYAKYLRLVFGREVGSTLTMTEREKELEDCFGRVDEKWVEDYYKFLASLQLKPSLLPPGEHVSRKDSDSTPRQNAPGGGGGKGGGGRTRQ
jgi:hypothetical protein